ncbi:MAG: glutamine-hydrolyzing GMP synthase [Cytophagales bacterium]|nr:MAG: glutamine-hydrolyzing GMP synthase [Cytophagales bacterium]TAF61957.1 MAG: glutamine-hydrolyzing GMP synthase [Cytophagales bacterium]
MTEKIIILDFGSQYTQLIARRIRELNVYCEIHPFNKIPALDSDLKGLILSGSPFSVHQDNAPLLNLNAFKERQIPILGLCYGAQMLAKTNGGEVLKSELREYGRAHLELKDAEHILFKQVSRISQVWMSHGDSVTSLPSDYECIAQTESIPIAAFSHRNAPIFGLQFHPEVTHSTEGMSIFKNFVVDICACSQNWTPSSFIEDTVQNLRQLLGQDEVVLALSGGVDSSVAAVLLDKAIGKRLRCIFVDNGLLRKNEFEQVLQDYQNMGLNIRGVDAKSFFYTALLGLTDPEAKRKAIGKAFIDIFEQETKQFSQVKWLGQGTIYPDVIESVSVKGPSATIKSHHNVGGLPQKMKLKVVEPLKTLFKDEVRRVGRALRLSEQLLGRHPFPGPGLGIRILGDITPEKVAILQEVDAIFINKLKEKNLYASVWQAGAMLLPVQSVGVMGDERTYERVVALRAVTSLDGMTADWCQLPYSFLAEVSNEIINRVKGVNRVVYDISSKPPATIEWE